MPGGYDERYDFFLSRRGSVAAIAREVADVLTEKGYKVLVQDYDIPLGVSFTDYAARVSRLIIAAPTDAPYPRSVAATFDLAITEATKQCPAAEPLMAYL